MQLYSYPVTWLYPGTKVLHKTYICHKTACDYSTQLSLMRFSLWQICRDTFKMRAGMHVGLRQLGSLKLSHINKNCSTDFCKIFLCQIHGNVFSYEIPEDARTDWETLIGVLTVSEKQEAQTKRKLKMENKAIQNTFLTNKSMPSSSQLTIVIRTCH